MAIYVLKPFDRNFKGEMIADTKLCLAARELIAGQYEASLGGGVYKKRIPLGAGKSGGARAIVAFKSQKNLFFVNGYAKSTTKSGIREIKEDELNLYRHVASQLFAM